MDIENQALEDRLRRRVDEILAFHTGQPVDRISKDTDRDYILGAPEAVEYGLVDDILTARRGLAPVAAVAGVADVAVGVVD